MRRIERLHMALIVIAWALFVSLYPISNIYADIPVIGGSQQMSTGGSQTLTVSGGSGGPYAWSTISGGGSLSSSTGNSVIYNAPNANPGCANNPTVRVTDSSGQFADLPIAVNASNSPRLAFIECQVVSCEKNGKYQSGHSPDPLYECYDVHASQYGYYCNGTTRCATPDLGLAKSACRSPSSSKEAACQEGCASACWAWGGCFGWASSCGVTDFRTSAMIQEGCCLASLPPAPGTQTGDTGGCGSSCPACPNVSGNSSANIKSGNLYDSLDVAKLTLSYNSVDPNDGPLGKKWTHTYNLKLTALSDNATLILKTEDGNVIYFRLSGGVYYPEARSGDASRIVKYSNGTYSRTIKNGTTYNFDTSGRLTSIIDRNSNTTTLTYSGSDLAGITDPNGRTITITSTNGKITAITDHAGRVYSLAYTNGLLSSVTDPVGNIWQYIYDTYGKMLTKRDPSGNTINYNYDAYGWLHQSVAPDGTRQMNYPQTGTAAVTEKDGGVWTYTYDPGFAVKTAKTDPLGNTTTYAYDIKRNLIAITAPGGSVTSYTYDANSNVTSVTDPLNNITCYTYNSLNLVASMTDPRGSVTTYIYDTKGNLLTVIAPLGAITTYQYDARGNVTAITDANNQTTALAYDSQNNLTSITDPLGKVTSFTYDAAGNRLSMTDPMGNVTGYAYNTLNQMTQVTDPKGNITHYTYDYKGNVLNTTDASGKPTVYAYNYRGQVTQITDALNNLTKMTYGPAGCGSGCGGAEKISSLTDALNHSTTYIYDLAGRLTKDTDPLGKEINYTYDARGNVITRTKPDGTTITYTYDAANRLTQKQYSDQSITQFQYDANGNMTYAGNQFIAYNFLYDILNRVTSVTDSNSRTIQYQYDALGNRTVMITPGNRTISYVYDAARRPTSIATNNGTYALAYDDAGKRTTLSYPNNTSTAYTYDNNGNLLRIRHKSGGSTIADINYTYDSVNNRLSRVDTATSASEQTGVETMSYDNANELLNLNTTTYNYDFNGNRIQKTETGTGTTYTYDDENRLTKIQITGSTNSVITYAYDPFGRRIEKNVNGTITRYLYDKEAIILEYDQVGTVQARYTHGLGIDEPFAMEKNGQMYYYHADALGSIVALTNASGSVVQSYAYDAFGNITSGTPTVTQPYTYTAREYDPETGLYFYRARYYDPKAGRFLTRDPLGFAGGVNLFLYTRNNPIRYRDPLGLYNEDVHLFDTYNIGMQVGLSQGMAAAIAAYDDYTDEKYNPFSSYANRENWHFVTLQRVNALLSNVLSSCDLEMFGEALHALQDYYSHTLQGYGPRLGHSYAGHAPDIPANNLNLYNQMLGATRDAMQRFKDKCTCPK